MYSITAHGQTSVLRKANFMKWINVICALILFALPVQAATVRYQHTDMLGSVVSESDESGNIISRSQYEPFGKRMGGDKEGIGYTGHLQDKDLGLTYMQARYYDPLIGRFYSNDPVDALGHIGRGNPVHGFNRYAYANNNPYMYTDPDGEFLQSIYGAIAGAVGGYVSSGEGFVNTAVGIVSGAIAGAVTGAVLPQASHAAGMAAAGVVASASGQALGSATTAAIETGEMPSLSDVKIDPVTTVAGGLGAGGGGLVAKGIANSTMKPIIGTTPISQAGAPTTAGIVTGAVVEGAITGSAEKVAPKIKEFIE